MDIFTNLEKGLAATWASCPTALQPYGLVTDPSTIHPYCHWLTVKSAAMYNKYACAASDQATQETECLVVRSNAVSP